jgi:hypothetical protein
VVIPTTNYTTSFATFICQADLSDVKRFCDATGLSQEGINLKAFWVRAFKEGRKVGQEEEYNRGYNAGYNEGYSDAGEKDYDSYEAGFTAGLAANASVSTTEIGTQVDFLPSPTPCIDISVQTTIDAPIQNSPPHGDISTQMPTISHLDVSIQASEPPPSPNQPQKVITTPLDWAEDANSLPLTLPPPSLPRQPRDLSVLRSSSSSPFSSLQHRSKRFTHHSRKPRHHRSHFHSNPHSNFNSFYSSHRNSFQPHSHSKTYSHLNWESDPRLSDLSRSLKALGWIRAS